MSDDKLTLAEARAIGPRLAAKFCRPAAVSFVVQMGKVGRPQVIKSPKEVIAYRRAVSRSYWERLKADKARLNRRRKRDRKFKARQRRAAGAKVQNVRMRRN